jgi:cytochrome c-type biogenesis protein CcmH
VMIRSVVALLLAAVAPRPSAEQQAAVVPPALSAAQDSAIDRDTRALASQLRCPVCQGLSIEDSPSELSQQMRALVRDQLRAGKSPDEVKRYFVSKYGEWILLSPPAHGVNTLIYALPLVALASGAALIAVVVRRWTRAPNIEEKSAPRERDSSDEITRV